MVHFMRMTNTRNKLGDVICFRTARESLRYIQQKPIESFTPQRHFSYPVTATGITESHPTDKNTTAPNQYSRKDDTQETA